MTRVNTVSPSVLTDEHLLVELRELSRIPNAIREGRAIVAGIPKEYSMGEGHVKFFYDKLLYIKKRHDYLRIEYKRRRGYDFSFKLTLDGLPSRLCNDWKPSRKDKLTNYTRLQEKLFNRKRAYHFNGLAIGTDEQAKQHCKKMLSSI